eukprot:417866-Heterocapsa_arctica.AAC.1
MFRPHPPTSGFGPLGAHGHEPPGGGGTWRPLVQYHATPPAWRLRRGPLLRLYRHTSRVLPQWPGV